MGMDTQDRVVREILSSCKIDASNKTAIGDHVNALITTVFKTPIAWGFTHAYLNGTAVPQDVARVTIFTDPALVQKAELPPNIRRRADTVLETSLDGTNIVLSVKGHFSENAPCRMSCKMRAAICCAKQLLYDTAGSDIGHLSPMWRMLELLGQNFFYSCVNKALLDSELHGFLEFLSTLDFEHKCYTGFAVYARDPRQCIGQPRMSSLDVLCRIINEGHNRGVVLDDFDDYKNVYPSTIPPETIMGYFANIHARFTERVLAGEHQTVQQQDDARA